MTTDVIQAQQLAVKQVKEAIGANAIQTTTIPRSTYDGEGYDVCFDFAVLWQQGPHWGAHSGVVRHKNDQNPTASIFWGHYDLTEKEAREVYEEKSKRLFHYNNAK